MNWLDLDSDGELEVEPSSIPCEVTLDQAKEEPDVSTLADAAICEDALEEEPDVPEPADAAICEDALKEELDVSKLADAAICEDALKEEPSTLADAAICEDALKEEPDVSTLADAAIGEDALEVAKSEEKEKGSTPRVTPEAAGKAEDLVKPRADGHPFKVFAKVEQVDYEDNHSDGEIMQETDAEADSEDVASSTEKAKEESQVEEAQPTQENSETSCSRSAERRGREKKHRRRRRHGSTKTGRERLGRHKRRHRRSSRLGQKRRSRNRSSRRTSPPPLKRSKTSKDSETVPRGQREVYVGGLLRTTQQEDISDAFTAAFQALPEYVKKYGDTCPVVQVHYPRDMQQKMNSGLRGDFSIFVFVEFRDPLLARTALKLSGFRILQRSVRICTSAALIIEGETLDVEPLRQRDELPFRPGCGAQMLLSVWLGSIPMRLCREEMQRKAMYLGDPGISLQENSKSLEYQISQAVLKLPGVQRRYPDLRCGITSMRISDCQRYTFVEAANELIASSMVAASRLTLPNGLEVSTGWPVSRTGVEERAPPPLAEDGSIADPSQIAALSQTPSVREEDFLEKQDCEIFMGGTQCIEVNDLWRGLTELLVVLPSYQKHFPDLSIPIINIRIGHGAYSFARLADPRLASTAVHIGEMFINGKKVLLRRPVHCDGHVSLPPPLDVIRALPKPPPVEGFRAHSDEGERLANQAKGAQAVNLEPAKEVPAVREIPPNPPKVPIVMPWHRRVHSVWVGNLPGRDQILAGMEEDDDEDDKGHKVLEVELMSRRLDQRLNELALKMPGYTLEDGPVIKRLSVHPSGRYAFVRVMGDQDFVEYLLDAWENQDFLGNPLRVAWQRRKDNPFMHKDKKRRLRRPLQVPAGLSEWLKPPIPDDDTAPRTEPFTAKEIEEL